MSIYRLIGDVHGKYGPYKTILKNSPYPTIQVGDMGVGFRRWPHGEWEINPPYDSMKKNDARFIRGNHDNPSACKRHNFYIPDGTVIDNMMFIGGAVSIDKAFRYPEYSWWEDEELSRQELEGMIDIYLAAKPSIMITHECPESVAALVAGGSEKLNPAWASRTRQAFNSMVGLHQPKLWVFGHWHVPFDQTLGGTRFVCLPELVTMDINTEEYNA